MFNRLGGCSQGIYATLNLGLSVGDDPGSVTANRASIKEALGLEILVTARQVHGDRIKTISSTEHDLVAGECDGLITTCPGVGLLIQQADCQAILLHDPVHRVIAALHNGWRGSVANIIGKAVSVMQNRFGTDPATLLAAISPSLGPCCAEFIGHKDYFPISFQSMRTGENHFDFWEISRQQLLAAGLRESRIDIRKICTMCSPDYFSHRRAVQQGNQQTGRQGSVIALEAGVDRDPSLAK